MADETIQDVTSTQDITPTVQGTNDSTTTYLGYPVEPLTDEEIAAIFEQMGGNPVVIDKGKRIVRTVAQVAVGFIIAAPSVVQVLDAFGADPSTHLGALLAGVGAGTTAIAGILSRIMAVPAVNSFLANLNVDAETTETGAKHAK